MLLRIFVCLSACLFASKVYAEPDTLITTIVPSLPQERWWGGFVALGAKMPYESNTPEYDMARQNFNNQVVPLMLSSRGRYVWGEHPYRFQFRHDTLILRSERERLEVVQAGTTLREAYLEASRQHFAPSGQIPDSLFFSKPQYNTWIELLYNQNQHDILAYADSAQANGFPSGIFMIDDNWQKYYGNFDFKPERFPDPRAMIETLHRRGFRVMLWVCPFVSPDSPEYRLLRRKGYLIRDLNSAEPALIHWWNGFSACYDLTNPEAVAYLRAQLDNVCSRYGVDGFKFDAGDVSYMQGAYRYHDPEATPSIFAQRWAELGLAYRYNELRSAWKLGGQHLVQRLGDKDYSWAAVSPLIPDMVTAGLLGHIYTCPDMIGGGQFASFEGIDAEQFDQTLIVRSAQVHSMMPMMQFSVAPWRILDSQHLDICAHYARRHEALGSYILELAKEASRTGEPIVRHLEYSFPHQGFVECRDQFMLGDRYLVAPMLSASNERLVRLPRGKWRDDLGKLHRGPKTLRIKVALDRLPYFEAIR